MPFSFLSALRLVPAALCLLATAAAQAPSWTPVAGPYGGQATGVASRADGLTAVAAAPGALYRTTTGGASWIRVDAGRDAFGGLFAAPNGDFWALGAPLLHSVDGGATWAQDADGLPGGDARHLAARPDGTLFAATPAGVFRRGTADAAWQPTAFTDPVSTVGVTPDGTVLAGLASTGIASRVYSVARSTDDGQTWAVVPVGSYREAEITGLVVFSDGSILVGGYPTSDTGRAASPFRSADAGLTWSRVEALPEDYVVQRAAGGVGSGTGSVAALTGFSPESVVTTDGGATWATVERTVTGIAGGPGGTVLVATGRFGILQMDAARAFTDATDGFGRADVGQIDTHGDLVVAARVADLSFGTGLYRSPDRGATWSRVALGFDARGLSDLHADPAGRLFASPGRCFGDACAAAGVYRSLDGGLTWATTLTLPGSYTAARFADGPGGALWALFTTRALYRSTDGGASWEPRASPPVGKTFTVGPDGTLWAGSDQPDVTVARSTDSAASWTTVLAPSPGLRTGAIAVAADGAVVVGAFGFGYRSPDGGLTWPTIDFGFEQPFYELDDLTLGPDGSLFAGADGGPPVLRSLDDGVTWAPVSDGLPEARFSAGLALGDDGVLWTALGANGLYRTEAPVIVAQAPAAAETALGLGVAPNPTRGRAAVTLTLAEVAHATVAVFDALGRRVALLHDGPAAGTLTLRWGAEALPAGVYVVRAAVGGRVASRRLVVAR